MKKNLAYIGLVLLILTWTSCESSFLISITRQYILPTNTDFVP